MSDETIIAARDGKDTISILSASAQRAALTRCAEAYNEKNGTGVAFTWATSGAVTKRIKAREPFDLVAASKNALAELACEKLVASNIVSIGVSKIALGVRKGEKAPDISTVKKFRDVLLSAESFARGDPAGGGTAGNHISEVLQQTGLLELTWSKSLLRVGGYNVMKEVAEGRADFGLTQSTEIMAVEGVTIGSWLPDALQLETVYAVVKGRTANSAAVDGFFDFVTGSEGHAIYAACGFAPVK